MALRSPKVPSPKAKDGPKESHNQGGDQGDCKHPVQPLWGGGQPERQPIAPPTQICIQILGCCEAFNLKFDFNFEIGLSIYELGCQFKNWVVSFGPPACLGRWWGCSQESWRTATAGSRWTRWREVNILFLMCMKKSVLKSKMNMGCQNEEIGCIKMKRSCTYVELLCLFLWTSTKAYLLMLWPFPWKHLFTKAVQV